MTAPATREEEARKLLAYWTRTVGLPHADLARALPELLRQWRPGRLHEAVDIVAKRLSEAEPLAQLRYFHGVLRRWQGEARHG